MLSPVRWRLLGVLALAALLVFVQGRAVLGQFQRGFRPFGHPPTRVAWSWDMFSIPIERCVMSFDPPVSTPERRLASFRSEVRAPFEWDFADNSVAGYKDFAKVLCENKLIKHAQLSCSTPRGPKQDRVDC